MKLQTLEEIETSIGGRPRKKGHKSERMTFYLPAADAKNLRSYSEKTDQTISQIFRALVRENIASG